MATPMCRVAESEAVAAAAVAARRRGHPARIMAAAAAAEAACREVQEVYKNARDRLPFLQVGQVC